MFPLGWNWHDMDPWLFPNEIRNYLGQTFNARSSGIVKLRNHSIGGRSPKSIFTLWQLWINICIFFQKFFWLFEQCPVQPLWVLAMPHNQCQSTQLWGLQHLWLANEISFPAHHRVSNWPEPGQRGAVGVCLTHNDQHATELTQCYNLHALILSSVYNIRMRYSQQTI